MSAKNLPFTKMSGAGNDFVLLEAARIPRGLPPARLARRLCRRKEGVGADGLLVLRRRARGETPVLDYYNADGSRAFCGNGSRCAAWWMHEKGWGGRRLRFDSSAGPIEALIVGREKVRLHMPDAHALQHISKWSAVRRPCRDAAGGPHYALNLKTSGKTWDVYPIDTGVPHAVIRVKNLERFPVFELGRALRRHPAFAPRGTNVNFVEPGPRGIALRTYERGVEDETLACGTGVVASAILSHVWSGRKPPIKVAARGGLLTVGFKPAGGGRFTEVWLEGPARITYHGEVTP